MTTRLGSRIAALPKAELHVHLEGSIRPVTACALARRYGVALSEEEVRERYEYANFGEFIEAFKWVTSFLREPHDFAVVAADLAQQLLEQNVVYAEVTLSVGVMLLRKQEPQANFEAILEATESFEGRGLRLNWIFDAVRQFGPEPAMRVIEAAQRCKSPRVVAFGMGGDELSMRSSEFRGVYLKAADCGLHRLIHAGEIGGPEKIREAVELLGVERVGHGIAAVHDEALMDVLADRRIALEICPTSNLRTGALARQIRNEGAGLAQHPMVRIIRHGVPVVMSTDDPAMFHTTLGEEYQRAHEMGLTEKELEGVVAQGFAYSFAGKERRAKAGRIREKN